ncbi:MAG: ATP-binding protein [Peptococcaceae bacterium]|nr:ATP-binding protein [Peptococcaceae bacterium]
MRFRLKNEIAYIAIIGLCAALVLEYATDLQHPALYVLLVVLGTIILKLSLSRQQIFAYKESLIEKLSLNLDLNRSLHKLLLNDSKTAIEVVNKYGVVVNWNDKAAEMTGYIKPLNQNHVDLFSQEHQTGQNKILETLATGIEYLDQEITLSINARDSIIALINTYTLKDKRGRIRGALAVYRDITVKKQMERQAQQADKFLALGQMAAGLAHEIRNPLTTVKGFLQLTMPTNPRHREYYTLMLDEVNRTNKLVSEFILLANPSAPSFVPTDLYALVEEVFVALEQPSEQKNIRLINRSANLPPIGLDVEQFKYLFLNLCMNSLDATPTNGTIGIAAEARDFQVHITVWDTGCGIPLDIIDRVFDPFFTTKDSSTGLGLSICYHIVQSHSGTITLESTPHYGTTIHITIPLQASWSDPKHL